jgi:hypothetical protein
MKNAHTTENQTPMETQDHQLLPAHRLEGQRSMQAPFNDLLPSISTLTSYTKRYFEASTPTSTSAHFVHAAPSHMESRTVPPDLVQTLLGKDRSSWIISEAIMLRIQRLCFGTIIHAAPRIRLLTWTQGFAELPSHFDSVLTVYGPSLIYGIAIILYYLYWRSLVELNCLHFCSVSPAPLGIL